MRNDALSVVSKLAASPNNVFTRQQAAQHGLDHRQIGRLISTGVLHEPWPGVLIALPPNGEPSWLQLMAAASRRDAAGSHRAGARLHRLDGFELCELLEISQCGHHRRLAGVSGHRVSALDRRDLIVIDGVRCTSLARTLCDLGSVSPPMEVERAFDDAIRRGTNVRWLRETALRLRRPGVTGPSVLLDLLDDHAVRGRVRDSWFEKLVELCLADPELFDLTRQHELRRTDGKVVARFDLAVPSAQLGIEAHSKQQHFGGLREASDERRDNAAGRLGWDVMYIGYAALNRPDEVLDEVIERVRVRRSQVNGSAS